MGWMVMELKERNQLNESDFVKRHGLETCNQEIRNNKKAQVIYMDNAATTYPKPECMYKAMDFANRCQSFNAGRGSYELAQMAMEEVDVLRSEILSFINGQGAAEVVLTPSATISFNQIIGGITLSRRDRVYVSPFEHNAVMRTLWMHQQKCGFMIRELPLNVDCLEIDLEKMEYQFRQDPPDYVFLSHISNVTGYLLPVEEICAKAKELTDGQAIVVLDAAQSFGIAQIDFKRMGFDMVVFAGHKTLYGPFGAAGFVKRNTFQLTPYLAGGTGSNSLQLQMPEETSGGLEPGSLNLPAIAGLHASMKYLKEVTRKKMEEHEKRLTDKLIEELEKIPLLRVYKAKDEKRGRGIVSFVVEGFQSGEIGMILDEEYGIEVRTGYHCAPLIHKYLEDELYGGTVRVSVGWFNKEEDVEKIVECVREIVEG